MNSLASSPKLSNSYISFKKELDSNNPYDTSVAEKVATWSFNRMRPFNRIRSVTLNVFAIISIKIQCKCSVIRTEKNLMDPILVILGGGTPGISGRKCVMCAISGIHIKYNVNFQTKLKKREKVMTSSYFSVKPANITCFVWGNGSKGQHL